MRLKKQKEGKVKAHTRDREKRKQPAAADGTLEKQRISRERE